MLSSEQSEGCRQGCRLLPQHVSRFARPTILGGGGAFRLAPIRQAAVRAATAADPPPCADSVVAAHAACSIGVLFDPKVVGTVTAYLQFGGSADPQAGIPLAGTGTLARPALTVARLSRTTVGAKAAAGLSLVLRTNFAGHGLLSVVPYACAVGAAVDRTSTHRCKGIVERPFTISAGRQRMRLRLHLRPGRYHVAVAAVPSRGGSRPLGRRMTLRVTR